MMGIKEDCAPAGAAMSLERIGSNAGLCPGRVSPGAKGVEE